MDFEPFRKTFDFIAKHPQILLIGVLYYLCWLGLFSAFTDLTGIKETLTTQNISFDAQGFLRASEKLMQNLISLVHGIMVSYTIDVVFFSYFTSVTYMFILTKDLGRSFMESFGRWIYVLISQILQGALILAPLGLASYGVFMIFPFIPVFATVILALMLVPIVFAATILLLVRMVFTDLLIVIDGKNPFSALKESYKLASGNFLSIVVLALSLKLVLWVIMDVVNKVSGYIGGIFGFAAITFGYSLAMLYPVLISYIWLDLSSGGTPPILLDKSVEPTPKGVSPIKTPQQAVKPKGPTSAGHDTGDGLWVPDK